MKICLVTPAPHGSRKGNRVTALRWAKILRNLGHRVAVEQEYRGQRCDLAVALHARRSFPSIERFSSQHPNLPLILALTGTDLYGDIHDDPEAQRSLEMATRLVVAATDGGGRAAREFARQGPGNFPVGGKASRQVPSAEGRLRGLRAGTSAAGQRPASSRQGRPPASHRLPASG